MKCYTCHKSISYNENNQVRLRFDRIATADSTRLLAIEEFLGLIHCTDTDPSVYDKDGSTITCRDCLEEAIANVDSLDEEDMEVY